MKTIDGVRIITDGKWKNFKQDYEIPKSVIEKEFNYLEKGEGIGGWIVYRKSIYHISDFVTLQRGGRFEKDWDGYISDSFYSGIFIKLSKDGEQYKIGRYFS